MYSKYNDDRLLVLIGGGDTKAFGEVYERYWSLLFRHAHQILNDVTESEDTIQEVFATLWKEAPTLEIKASLSTYLYTLVRNRVFNAISKKKVRSAYSDSFIHFAQMQENTVDHHLLVTELAQIIESELENMPPKMREVFELSRFQYLSHEEIGKKLNISNSVIKKHINKALHRLRKRLGIYYFFLF